MKKILLTFFTITLLSCSSDDGGSATPADSFDRGAMLVNWADNIILPSYDAYQSDLATLETATAAFITSPDQTNLDALRVAMTEAYTSWQYVAPFNFGKAEADFLYNNTNIFPCDATAIDTALLAGSFNLDLPSSNTMQGFPAIDYLVSGIASTDADILVLYTGSNASLYTEYFQSVVTKLKDRTDVVVADWNGGYRDSYVASTGNTATSSVNVTVNKFIQYYESNLRTGKVGIPVGAFTSSTFPEKVEAYYTNTLSKELCVEALKACQDFFNGKYYTSNTTGESLSSYLAALGTESGGIALNNTIDGQFSTAITSINGLSNSFSEQVINDSATMLSAYDELQSLVVYLKTDMVSAMDISVSYVDNDGD